MLMVSRKIIGPAMPPAPLDERPSEFPTATGEDSDSDSDDDFMPALPSAADAISATNEDNSEGVIPEITGKTPGEEKLKRDDWMMMPPKQDDLAARLDPSKQRPTKFNTGKGARGPAASDGDNSLWNETPEQRQKRLQDEIMGVSKAATATRVDPAKAVKSRRDEEAHRKIQQHTVRCHCSIRGKMVQRHCLGGTRSKRRELSTACPSTRVRIPHGEGWTATARLYYPVGC
jgi:hypothetical protein